MLRFRPSTEAKAGYFYFTKSDSGLEAEELRKEVGGKGSTLLGLSTTPDFDQFKRLLHGLDPHTGEQLTAKLVDGRISYWDITASVPKGVTVAIERGDRRVHDALWEAGREAMGDIEGYVKTRMRKGGVHDDRPTENLIWYAFEHPETRPSREDGIPDPDRHIHFVVPNLTYDEVEGEWKAIKFREIMEARKFFDRRFDLRLASKLADLGYGIETKRKAGKYFSWDIRDMPVSVLKKYSRRSAEVEALAERLGVVSPVGKDKLGATSRLHKRDDMTLEDYRQHWEARLTPDESRQIGEVIKAAILGQNPAPENTAEKGIQYAIGHEFHTRSVVDWHDLAVTAMERCMGGAKPEDIDIEARKQGVLLKDGEATTRDVLAEERRIIEFARDGKGVCTPLGRPGASTLDFDWLSSDQKNILRHLWGSMDRVMLVRGAAGTGKTTAMKETLSRIDRPVAILAPSVDASRGVLRRDGFAEADTVAAFLGSKEWQEKIGNGVIYVDEAGQLPIKDLSRLVEIAKRQNARIILQGDPKQHKSVARHGNMFRVLQQFAGLPVAELKDIRRQSGRYKEAVAAIERGNLAEGHDILDALGWIQNTDDDKHLVDAYMEALATKRPGQADRDRALVLAPTHAEGKDITAEIRRRMREQGKLTGEERSFTRLVQQTWSDAEKEDPERYDGSEVIQFFRHSGQYRAGQRVRALDFRLGQVSGEHFAVYKPEAISLAVGDTIRTTSNVPFDDKRIDNGTFLTVTGFTRDGKIETVSSSGIRRTLAADVGHINHGYVSTSFAGQGKTVDRVFAAMGTESLPAVRMEQFYVDLSRAREKATVFTDLHADDLRKAIQRQDKRKSATELMGVSGRKPRRHKHFIEKVRDNFRRLRERAVTATREAKQHEQELYYGR